MSDTVLTVLIVAIAIIVVLFMFRERLRNFIFKANKDGVEANLETNQQDKTLGNQGRQPSVNISGNRQIGKGNRIDVGRSNVNVEKNLQKGDDEEIVVRPQKSGGKKKR